MSDITQEQVDELVKKPSSKWTDADRVLLSKARKAGLKVELPDEEPAGAVPAAHETTGDLSPEEEMTALMAKPKGEWSPQDKSRFAELAKMGVKVKKSEAAPVETAAEAGGPPSDDPKAQAQYLQHKPKGQWTAADRVLLSKLRKDGVAVNLPEEAPREAPPKKKETPASEAPKKAEPDIMGPYLQVLYRMRVGTEELSPEKVAEFKSKADGWLKEVVEEMGKEDFNLEDLSKKDITLRQRYERAMLIYEGIEKLTEASLPGGSGGRPRKFWEEKKRQIFKGLFKRS